MSANGNGSAARELRLCRVRKTADFDGYGFNLHAEKGKPFQYIGEVDAGSPAESAGLRRGDCILEVNERSIADDTHDQVVARIKERPDEAALLVVAPPSPPSTPATPQPPQLNLKMSAAEMRAHLVAKKKN